MNNLSKRLVPGSESNSKRKYANFIQNLLKTSNNKLTIKVLFERDFVNFYLSIIFSCIYVYLNN
jgi:hypothetical protein